MFKRITILLITVLSFSSCQQSKINELMNAKEASYTEYTNGKKNIRFVRIIHISTKDFYNDVAKKVTDAKKNGYVLFYEFVDFDKATDPEKRKLRKLVGFIPTPEAYKKQLESLKGEHVEQENSQFMNLVNNKDFNVDVTPSEILKAYEKEYGKIELTDTDMNTPISETITDVYPKDRFEKIILDFRNKHLADAVNTSKYDKIIILYGTEHEKGLIRELKKSDPNWKEA
jgi:hypothetical protein